MPKVPYPDFRVQYGAKAQLQQSSAVVEIERLATSPSQEKLASDKKATKSAKKLAREKRRQEKRNAKEERRALASRDTETDTLDTSLFNLVSETASERVTRKPKSKGQEVPQSDGELNQSLARLHVKGEGHTGPSSIQAEVPPGLAGRLALAIKGIHRPEPMEADPVARDESDYGDLELALITVQEESMAESDSEQQKCRELDREIATAARENSTLDLNLQASDEGHSEEELVLKTGTPDKNSRKKATKAKPVESTKPDKHAKAAKKSTKDSSSPRESSRATLQDTREPTPSSREADRMAGYRGRDILAIAAG